MSEKYTEERPDISIPEVEIDHNRTGMIADAIMKQYGEKCEDPENMRSRILAKLEASWAEIVTGAKVVDVNKLFGEELRAMGQQDVDELLYIKDDFVYLGDYGGFDAHVIYATQDALEEKLTFLDDKIINSNTFLGEKRVREALVKYAREQDFNINITSIERIETIKEQQRRKIDGLLSDRFFKEHVANNPTARRIKIEKFDTIFDVAYKMSEGVPGAMVGIAELMKSDEMRYMLLLSLDDMNIRGMQIWKAYKHLYNEDARKFAEAIRRRDRKMVDFINQELAFAGGEKAVVSGASVDRSEDPNKYRFTEKEVEELRAQRKERIGREKANKQSLITNKKRSLEELDRELTSLQERERQIKKLYDEKSSDKSHEEK